ncbi:MAG: sugar phosphate nucleotidyltransferase [Chloroflexota bacterium]|nr:sugar phosphate nucleotidyltransferase [Chloroflexota bacterium]
MTKPLKIVIPMAGFGTRLRPLTWSKPKPLIALAGKTVLDHVVNMFRSVPDFESAEFVFILGPMMGEQIQEHVAKHYPDWHVDYAVQPKMKGQSDAFWQAREYLHGPMLMAFSDTLIEVDFSFIDSENKDGVAWVQPVPDPKRFGVAELDQSGAVTRLIEKPDDMGNNLALVGCYYFKEAEDLIDAIKKQVDDDIALKSEYYLVDAINILLERGLSMRTENVETWLDAGTPEALHETNRYLLAHGHDNTRNLDSFEETLIIPPVFIHPGVNISQSVIGPNTSIDEGAVIQGSIIKDSILATGVKVRDSRLNNSLLGHDVTVTGLSGTFNLGDNSSASY